LQSFWLKVKCLVLYPQSNANRFLGGMTNVICVSTAKVPIVKIYDPELGLACDMNVNNTLALENTRMIKTYVEIDPRVRPLAMIIKHWTKRRIVNDAGKKVASTSSTQLISGSFWWDSQFVHLDMHDYQLPPNPKSSAPPPTTPLEAPPQRWR
jgi:hypothetical protein